MDWDLPEQNSLRWYQQEAYKAVMAKLKEDDSTLVLIATGLGKTILACEIARQWVGNVLFIAHREEIIEQNRRQLAKHTGEYIGVEQAEWRSGNERLVVGSVQSIQQDLRLKRLGKDRFSLIIADEFHHYVSRTYRKVLDFFDSKVVGLTATPDRTDEKALGQICDSVAYVLDIADGVKAGYLVPVLGTRVTLDEVDISKVKKSGKDLNITELDEAMVKGVEGVVKKTLELEPDRQGLCFFPGVKSAELAAERFNALRPGSAFCIHAKTDPDLRKQMVGDFKSGRYRYFCNCMIATEGFDAPTASLIVQARPTLSRLLCTQMVGRGLRPLPFTIEHVDAKEESEARRHLIAQSAKPNTMILDFVGNCGRHEKMLMTPVDILGGDYTPAEVRRARQKAEKQPGSNPMVLLEEARRELVALANAMESRVQATVSTFDPFAVFHMDLSDRYVQRFGYKPATPGQLAALRKFKIPENQLVGLSKRAASKLLGNCVIRAKNHLATYGQLRTLQKFGVNKVNLSFSRASQAIDYLASTGWGKNRAVDPNRLYDIVGTSRQPGEEG